MKKKGKTIGELSQTRMTWAINPVTRVKTSKKSYNRKRDKQALRRRKWE